MLLNSRDPSDASFAGAWAASAGEDMFKLFITFKIFTIVDYKNM
jgi:hypothetical protein